MGQRFFAIDVFSLPHRGRADVSMQMVGRGTQDGVDCLFFLQHGTKILIVGDLVVGRLFREMLLNLSFQGQPPGSAVEIKSVEIL